MAGQRLSEFFVGAQWQMQQAEQLLNEFVDVTAREKVRPRPGPPAQPVETLYGQEEYAWVYLFSDLVQNTKH